MRRWLLPVLAALAGAGVIVAIVVGHGHTSSAPPSQKMRESAPAFLTSVLKLLLANRYADAWKTLNPAHQAVAPLAEYVACQQSSPFTEHLVSVRVLAVGHERIRLVPHGPRVDSTAVTFGTILSSGGSKSPAVLHLHAVPGPNGDWTWILPPDRYALYKSNSCTGTSTTQSPP